MRERLIHAIGRPLAAYRAYRSQHAWVIVPFMPLEVVGVAWLLQQWWPAWGRSVNDEFYGLVAQVIPVLLLTFLVNRWTSVEKEEAIMRELIDRYKEFDQRQAKAVFAKYFTLMRGLTLSAVSAAVVGEALTLYAVAAQETSTFLLVGSAAALARIGWELIRALTRGLPGELEQGRPLTAPGPD